MDHQRGGGAVVERLAAGQRLPRSEVDGEAEHGAQQGACRISTVRALVPTLEGDHGRRIVVEHDWVDYYVDADSPQRRVRVLEIDDLRAEQHTRRKFVAFGAKEPFVTVSVRGGPTFFSMTVTGAEGVERARAFVDELRARVATARARTA